MRSQQREHVDLIPGRHTSEHPVPPIHNTKGRQQNNNFVLTSLGGAVSCSGNVLARRSFRFPRALESNGVDCVEVLRNTIEDYANPKFKKAIFIMYSTVLQYVFIYYYMVYPRLFFEQRRTVYRVTRYVRYPGVS